jgi:hypothetical protein
MFEKLVFYDDNGLIFHSNDAKEVPKIGDMNTMYVFDEKQTMAQIILEGPNFCDVYQRSYAKAQDLLTRIGGLIKALKLIYYFLNYLFSKAFLLLIHSH